MKWFISSREKKLWAWTLAVIIAIFSTLGLSGKVLVLFTNRALVDMAFALALILIAVAIAIHGIRTKTGNVEIAIWIGVFAVYLLMFTRMSIAAERSHLIEYGVLAILIFEALKERFKAKGKILFPSLIAVLISGLIGIIDESLQLLIPFRVFDPEDMLFNFLAAIAAIGSSLLLSFARKIQD